MFLRATTRKKDGKEHSYWSIVENRRLGGGRVLQRHALYLGEVNSSQERAWRRSIEVLDEHDGAPRTLALFPEDRCAEVAADESVVRLRLSQLRLCRPRQWGACWLVLRLWQQLGLGDFWAGRLPRSRKGTRWDQVLLVLTAYRLVAPGSEWRLHRQWYEQTALSDLLGADAALADIHKLYACHDHLLAHKTGGEEFTVILPEAERDVGLQRAKAILAAAAQRVVSHQGVPLGRITTSIGMAVLPEHGTTGSALLEAADKALYQAKSDGRNRVSVAAHPS